MEKMFLVSFPIFSIREAQIVRKTKNSVWQVDSNLVIHRRLRQTEFCEYFKTLLEAKTALMSYIQEKIYKFDNSSHHYKKTHKKRKKELQRKLKYLQSMIH